MTKERKFLINFGWSIHKYLSEEKTFDEDSVSESVKIIYRMGITSIKKKWFSNTYVVELARPGLLIGKGGSLIRAIEKDLGIKIKIKESYLTNDLLGFSTVTSLGV